MPLSRIINTANPVNHAHPLNRGLVSWWLPLPHLVGGSLFDLVGQSIGTSSGPTWGVSNGRPAFNFTNGSTTNVSCSDIPGHSVGSALTVSAFTTCTGGAGYRTLFSKPAAASWTSPYSRYLVRIEGPTAKLAAWVISGANISNYCFAPSVFPSDGSDQHVAITYDGVTLILYQNGINVASVVTNDTGAIPASTYPFLLGNAGVGDNESWHGAISSTAIYNRVLSADEMLALSREAFAGFPKTINRISPVRFLTPHVAGAFTLSAAAGSFALTGQSASLKVGHKLTTAPGSFAETGMAAGLTFGRKLVTAPGSFAETGIAATLKATRILATAAGSFTETGQAANLNKGRTILASAGAFTLTGIAAGLTSTRKLSGAAGSFTLTGQAATLTKFRGLITAPGAFTLTGLAAGLTSTRKLATAPGAFTLTGLAATLSKTRGLITAPGSFALTGIAAGFGRIYRLPATPGTFTFTGLAAGLSHGGVTLSFRQAVVSALKASPSISAIVGAKVFPIQVPESQSGPWVLYQIGGIDRLHDLDGVTGVATTTVRIGCGSSVHLECEALALAVYNLFDGQETALAVNGITQLETVLAGEYDYFEPNALSSTDLGTYWCVLTFTFRYLESPPA